VVRKATVTDASGQAIDLDELFGAEEAETAGTPEVVEADTATGESTEMPPADEQTPSGDAGAAETTKAK
jgi:trigger factor